MSSSPSDQKAAGPGPSAGSTRQPGEVTAATLLSILTTVLWLPIAGQYGYPTGANPMAVWLFLYVLFAVLARRGRRWARIAVTIVGVWNVFVLLPYVFASRGNPYAAAYAVIDLVAVLACCTGLVLLYLPTSNAYFRERRAQNG